jgi:hypothetical protein
MKMAKDQPDDFKRLAMFAITESKKSASKGQLEVQ